VDKMAKDAEAHKADDSKRKDEIDARNRADAMVYNVEKMLKEHRDKISEADAKNVESAVEETKKAIADGKLEAINAATDKLTQASHKLAEAMYRTAAPQGGAPGSGADPQPETPPSGDGAGQAKKDNVVDAEFVDVDDKK